MMYNDYKTHIVKKYESFPGIAEQYSVLEDDLIKANPHIDLILIKGGLFSSDKWVTDVKEGDTLKIPFLNEDKAKKGVKAITGKTTVKPGEWEEYKVTGWYEGTPPEDRNEDRVRWALYLLHVYRPPEKVLEKETGHFRFMQKATGQKFRVVGYMYEPELDNDSSLVVKVAPTEKREIQKILLKDAKFQPISGPLSYGQKINVYVSTTGMTGEYLHLSLWEDDAKGGGHSQQNEANHNLVAEAEVRVSKHGIASYTFLLKPDFAKMANAHLAAGDKSEGSKHEYYVTAYADDHEDAVASSNVNVNNPGQQPATPEARRQARQEVRQKKTKEHLAESKAPKKNETIPPFKKRVPVKHKKPAYEPAPTAPKPVPAAPQPAPGAKPAVTDVLIRDSKGQPITGTFTGSKIRVYIYSTGLKGKKVKMSLYEDDLFDQLLLDRYINLSGDRHMEEIAIAAIPKSKGDDFFEGNEQELFVTIEVPQLTGIIDSKTIDVDVKSFKPDPPDGVSVSKVGAADMKDGKKEDKNNCPNCDKDITLDDIKKICVSKKNNKGEEKCLIADLTMITAAIPFLNEYRKLAKINTCVRKAHFLAQIAQESKFYDMQEGFTYTDPERMRKLFNSYFKGFGSKEKQLEEAKRLSDLSLDSKNHPEVANAIYGDKHPTGKNHTDPSDGWRYSGKGFKQITWKDNYVALQKYVKDTYNIEVEWVGGDNPYKLKNNAKDAMLSAIAFWGKNNINSVATKISYESVEKVTKKINPSREGLEERRRYFKKAVEVLKTDECQPKEDLTPVAEKGTVVIMSGVLFKLGTEKTNAGKQWPVYKTSVYHNMGLESYTTLSDKGKLPAPDYIIYLSRDAHNKPSNAARSTKRYGSLNEAPPGTYYLNKRVKGQSYYIYLSDTQGKGESGITGPDGWRGGIAIHGGWPEGTEGCLTTHTANYGNIIDKQPINPLVQELIDNLPDFEDNTDDKPVRFIIEERVATKSGKIWIGESM